MPVDSTRLRAIFIVCFGGMSLPSDLREMLSASQHWQVSTAVDELFPFSPIT